MTITRSAAILLLFLSLFNVEAVTQPTRLYLAGTAFNPDLNLAPPNNGYVTQLEAVNANYPVTFDRFFLTQDIVGTSYTFAIRCRSNGTGGRLFSARVQIGGQDVASVSWNVSSTAFALYTNTVTGSDPTISGSTEVKLIVTINGTSGATSAISMGDASQTTPLYSYIEIPPTANTSAEEETPGVDGFVLEQAFPNPFNPGTTIRYHLPSRVHVLMSIHNILGQEVVQLVNREMEQGHHEITVDGSGLPAGVYLCRLSAGGHVQTVKVVLER